MMDDGIASGFSGQMYQVGMTMLFSIRAKSKDYLKFSIRSELKDAGAFDDLKFVADEDEVEYIQLKSKESCNMFITASHLFQQNPNKIVGDYNLLKYIISCMKIKEQVHIKNGLQKLKRVIVFTNISLDVICIDSITKMKLRNIQGDTAQAFTTLGITEINVMEVNLAKNDILTFENNSRVKYYKFNDPQLPTIVRSIAETFRNQLLSKYNSGKNEYDKWLIDNFDQFTLDEIENCLDKIIFACNQPNDEELFEVIKADFKEYCNVNCDEIFHKLKFNIEQWMKLKSGAFPGVITENVMEKFFQENSKVVTFEVTDPISTFTGRELELEDLYTLLHEKGNALVIQAKTAGISGLGGVGKTQLAKMYIKRYLKNYYGRAIWITAESTTFIENAFKKLGRKILNVDNLTTAEIIDRVVDYFKHYKVLFVFDNAETHPDDERDDHIAYFRKLVSTQNSFQTHILITSRDRQYIGNACVFDLNMLNIMDAITLIKEQLPGTNDDDAKILANLLQQFPLALQQAISFIKIEKDKYMLSGKQYTVENYVKTFEENSRKLLDHKFKTDEGRTYAQTTRITWMTTLNTIEQDEEVGKVSMLALKIMAYLNPDKIDYRLVEEILKKQFKIENKITKSAHLLIERYSMVTKTMDWFGFYIFQIHRLVQETIRNYLFESGEEESILDQLLCYDFYTVSLSIVDVNYCVSHVIKYKSLLEKYKNYITKLSPKFLYAACEAGNVKLVKYLLENYKLKNDLDSVVEKLWKIAIKNCNVNMVEVWINYMRNINPFFYSYRLYDILSPDNEQLIELCIEKGARINVMNTYGRTYLHEAAEEGNVKIVKMLLNPKWFQMTKNKIENRFRNSPKIVNKVKETRLLLTSKNLTRVKDLYRDDMYSREIVEEIELLELLIEDNFNVDTFCFTGFTAFYYAFTKGHLEIMQILCEHGADLNNTTSTKINLLQHLYENPINVDYKKSELLRFQVAKFLVQLGINLNHVNRSGDNILQTIVESIEENMSRNSDDPYVQILNILLSKSICINAQNNLGETVLHKAAKIGDISIIKYLIENGAEMIKDNEGNTPFHSAYLHGNLVVAKILQEKMKMNWNDTNLKGQTYLHLAIMSFGVFVMRKLNVFLKYTATKDVLVLSELLLEHELDADKIMHFAENFFHAIKYEFPDVDDLIKINWAKINQANEIKIVELLRLLQKRYVGSMNYYNTFSLESQIQVNQKVKFLLENKIIINLRDDKGNTALHYSVMYCCFRTTKLLLKHGANPNMVNNNGDTSLHLSIRFHILETTKKLLTSNKMNLLTVDQNGNTLLHLLVGINKNIVRLEYSYNSYMKFKINKFIQLIEEILLNKIDPNLENNDNCTAFDIALRQKDSILTEYLIGITDINVQKLHEDEKTYLHLAVQAKSKKNVLLILQKCPGIDINALDSYGNTALNLFLKLENHKDDDIEIIELLVKNSADVNLGDHDKKTPLHNAVTSHNFYAFKYLNANGGILKLQDKNGDTPFDLLLEQSIEYISSILHYSLESDASLLYLQNKHGLTLLHKFIEMGQCYYAEFLLTYENDWNTTDIDGNSLLHSAVKNNNMNQILERMCQKGISVNLKNHDGDTPLYIAIASSNNHAIEILLKYNADVSQVDSNGNTALHLVSHLNYTREIVELLIQSNKECLKIVNKDGRTPKDIVYLKHRFDLYEVFEKYDTTKPKHSKCSIS